MPPSQPCPRKLGGDIENHGSAIGGGGPAFCPPPTRLWSCEAAEDQGKAPSWPAPTPSPPTRAPQRPAAAVGDAQGLVPLPPKGPLRASALCSHCLLPPADLPLSPEMLAPVCPQRENVTVGAERWRGSPRAPDQGKPLGLLQPQVPPQQDGGDGGGVSGSRAQVTFSPLALQGGAS